jgi:hypothetical protein
MISLIASVKCAVLILHDGFFTWLRGEGENKSVRCNVDSSRGGKDSDKVLILQKMITADRREISWCGNDTCFVRVVSINF